MTQENNEPSGASGGSMAWIPAKERQPRRKDMTMSDGVDKGSAAMRGSLFLAGWNGKPIEVWEDADGDVGFIDEYGHSIIVSRQAVPHLSEWLDAMRWIPIDYRRPKHGTRVLARGVVCTHGFPPASEVREVFCHEDGFFIDLQTTMSGVTHWMPLPSFHS